jgi:pilus assembly protein TadC
VSESQSAVRTILNLGEEKMSEVIAQLMGNPSFVQSLQKAVTSSLEAKRNVDKGVSSLLSFVNIPSIDDVEKLRKRLQETEDAVAMLNDRLSSLLSSLTTDTAPTATAASAKKSKEPKRTKTSKKETQTSQTASSEKT